MLTQFLLFLKVDTPERERSVAQREEPKSHGFRHSQGGAHGEPMNRALLPDERQQIESMIEVHDLFRQRATEGRAR